MFIFTKKFYSAIRGSKLSESINSIEISLLRQVAVSNTEFRKLRDGILTHEPYNYPVVILLEELNRIIESPYSENALNSYYKHKYCEYIMFVKVYEDNIRALTNQRNHKFFARRNILELTEELEYSLYKKSSEAQLL